MISKPVPARSFYHTCNYIANKPGAEILIAEGVRSHDVKLMAEDFERQRQLHPSKELACFHGILSFYPGENPSDEIMTEIAGKYLQRLGITNTQYVASKHTDKAHLHLHIVANMVNNEGNIISDSWIGLRGKKVAQALTKEYKLIPAIKKNLQFTHLESMNELEVGKYKIYMAIAENLPHCHTLEELEAQLRQQGIETLYKYKGQTQEKQGISFKTGEYSFKGSQVDRKFSLAGLRKALALQEREHLQEPRPVRQQQQVQQPERKLPLTRQRRTVPKEELKNDLSELTTELMKGAAGIIDDLLKPEDTHEQVPYEFTLEGYLRRQRKQNRRPKRG